MESQTDAELQLVLGDAPKLGAEAGIQVTPQSHRRADVDGLRALAVTAVVVYHLNPQILPGGFVGVDIFFVISGYVVSSSLVNRWGQGQSSCTEFVLDFYARRIQRLFPALVAIYWFGTMLIAFLVPYWLNSGFYEDSSIFALLGSANIYFAREAVSYWEKDFAHGDAKRLNVFLHTWSLGVEEQFYVVFSLLVCLAGGMRSTLLTVILISLAVGSSCFCVYLEAINPTSAFYLLPARFWELAIGALVLQLETRIKGPECLSWWFDLTINIFSACFLCMSLIACKSDGGFPLPWAAVPVAGSCCFIAAGWNTMKPAKLNTLFSTPWIVYIGEMSYCIYLVHWPTIVAFKWLSLTQMPTYMATIPLICLLSACLYHLWEKPLRAAKTLRSSIFFIAAVSVLLGCAWWWVLVHGGHRFLYEWGPMYSPMNQQSKGKSRSHASSRTSKSCAKPTFSMFEPPFISRGDTCACQWTGKGDPPPGLNWTCKSAENLQRCMIERLPMWSYGKSTDFSFALHSHLDSRGNPWDAMINPKFVDEAEKWLGRERRNVTDRILWLIGDSHAEVMANGLHAALPTMKLVVIASFPRSFERLDEKSNQSIVALTSALAHVVREGDIVANIYAAMWHSFNSQHSAAYESRLRDIQKIVVSRKAKLVLFGDWQNLTHPAPMCLAQRKNCSRSKATLRQERVHYYRVMQNLKRMSSVFYMDLLDVLCDGDTCDMRPPGFKSVCFADDSHLNDIGSYYLAPFLCQFMRGIHALS